MRKLWLMAAVVLIAGAANPLRADTMVGATYLGGQVPSFNGGPFNWRLDSIGGSPGVFNPVTYTVVSGPSVALDTAAVGQNFTTFCIQTSQYINNPSSFTVKALEDAPAPVGANPGPNAPMTFPMATAIRKMWGTDDNRKNLELANGTGDGSSAANATVNQKKEAFQRAIWVILGNDGTGGYADQTPGAGVIKDLFDEYMLDSVNGTVQANLVSLVASGQDQIAEVVGNTPPPETPLPPGVGMMLAGVVPMFGYLRLRRKKA